MRRSVFPILVITFSLCCSSGQMDRRATPKESVRMETLKAGRGLVRSMYCDLYADELNPSEWERLFDCESFKKKIDRSDIRSPRIPELLFIRIMLRNTSKFPIRIGDVTIVYGKNTAPALDRKALDEYIRSPMYTPVNWDYLLAPRTLLQVPETEIINYDKDSVRTTLDFIPSGDTVMRIIPFQRVPVQERDFTLKLTVTDGRDKKIIDFEFHRFEYRTSGKDFLKPEKKERDED